MKYVLPTGYNSDRMVMIHPNAAFDAAWHAGDGPERSDPAGLSQVGIRNLQHEIRNDPDTTIRLPEIAIDIENGQVKVYFTDGRSRVTSLRGLGITEIPVMVSSNVPLSKLYQLPFVSPVSEQMRQEIEDASDGGLSKKLRELEEDPGVLESIKKWARDPENIRGMQEYFKDKGYGLIADELIEYYQKHGKMPPQHEIDAMMKSAMEAHLEAGKTIDFWVVEKHGDLLEPAEHAVAQKRAAVQREEILAAIRRAREVGKEPGAEQVAEPSHGHGLEIGAAPEEDREATQGSAVDRFVGQRGGHAREDMKSAAVIKPATTRAGAIKAEQERGLKDISPAALAGTGLKKTLTTLRVQGPKSQEPMARRETPEGRSAIEPRAKMEPRKWTPNRGGPGGGGGRGGR